MLYPLEDKTHHEALEYIKLNYDCAYIVHDKDVNEVTGEIKKSHTHVVIRCDNAKWNTALSKDIGLVENYIQDCRSYKNALMYLIHYNDDTKEQYDIDCVQGSLKKKLRQILESDDKTEHEKASEIIDWIYMQDHELFISDLARYSISVGMWDVFRRAQYIFTSIMAEHNTGLHNIKRTDKE